MRKFVLEHDKDVIHRFEKAVNEYHLTVQDLKVFCCWLEKLIPVWGVQKEDLYGNEYHECPDCGKKFTYRHFDGFCEQCGQRLIW